LLLADLTEIDVALEIIPDKEVKPIKKAELMKLIDKRLALTSRPIEFDNKIYKSSLSNHLP
jgi:hypothetical protein